VVENSERLFNTAGVCSADDVRLWPKTLVQYSPERGGLNRELRRYLYRNLYYNPVVNEPHIRAKRLLQDLFHYYLKHPAEIGTQSRRRVRRAGLQRVVCDYLAGMTDRYVLLEHGRLCGKKRED